MADLLYPYPTYPGTIEARLSQRGIVPGYVG
jgi:hypothetical protein